PDPVPPPRPVERERGARYLVCVGRRPARPLAEMGVEGRRTRDRRRALLSGGGSRGDGGRPGPLLRPRCLRSSASVTAGVWPGGRPPPPARPRGATPQRLPEDPRSPGSIASP